MDTSCGVIIKFDNTFLVCHPTGARWKQDWSIPKGIMDPNESEVDTAVREVFEETGIKLNKSNLKFLGKDFYRTGKDLIIFETIINSKPDNLECNSYFEPFPNAKKIPEVDKFAWITFNKAELYLNKNLYRLFQKFVKEF